MMKQMQGRSLAHPGCLVGITAGLTMGIIVAGVLAAAFNAAMSVILLVWLALTLGLGLLGWIIGERLSIRFFRDKRQTPEMGSVSSDLPPSRERMGS